jgi:hypothetical protein
MGMVIYWFLLRCTGSYVETMGPVKKLKPRSGLKIFAITSNMPLWTDRTRWIFVQLLWDLSHLKEREKHNRVIINTFTVHKLEKIGDTVSKRRQNHRKSCHIPKIIPYTDEALVFFTITLSVNNFTRLSVIYAL